MDTNQLPRTDWTEAANRLHMILSQSLSDEALDELLVSETEFELVYPARVA
ncbi:MAG: hypothetical protein ACRDZ3_01155 [Acidimicrobiia bacterium]